MDHCSDDVYVAFLMTDYFVLGLQCSKYVCRPLIDLSNKGKDYIVHLDSRLVEGVGLEGYHPMSARRQWLSFQVCLIEADLMESSLGVQFHLVFQRHIRNGEQSRRNQEALMYTLNKSRFKIYLCVASVWFRRTVRRYLTTPMKKVIAAVVVILHYIHAVNCNNISYVPSSVVVCDDQLSVD